MIVANEQLDLVDDLGILEDERLRLEDPRFLNADVLLDASAKVGDALPCLGERVVKVRDLHVDLLRRHQAQPHRGHFPEQHMRGPDDNARRSRDTDEDALHYFSPNFCAMRSAIASTACWASGPLARMVSVAPNSAASIITPMMLFPFTSRSSRTMVISLLNFAAVFTTSAAGRACRPFLFTICTDRSVIIEPPRRRGRRRRGRQQRSAIPQLDHAGG